MTTPRTFKRPMRRWYLKNRWFQRYMLRELTAVFLAAYAILLLIGLAALRRGPAAWADFSGFLTSPLSIGLHLLIFVAALYHSISWFAVSPKAMPPVRIGAFRVPDRALVAGQLVALAVLSLALCWLAGVHVPG